MIFDLRGLLRAVWLKLTKRRPTARRVGFLCASLAGFALLFVVVLFGRLLDEVLFRGYRRQPVREPVFIIANPRSGTTFLHRLMCLDEERFTYFKAYQTLLPSVFLYKLVGLLAFIGQLLGRPLARWRSHVERQMFAQWDGIHTVGFGRAEEDVALFLYTFYTPAAYLLFPFLDEIPYLQFADRLRPDIQERLRRYYRGCIQRHLYATGDNRMLLTKNVFSTGRVRWLLETFPDARLIYLVRHPYEAIPSLLSLFYAAWQVHSPDIAKASPETRAVSEMGFEYYRYIAESRKHLPQDRFLCVHFEDLVEDPQRTVGKIYQRCGWPLSEVFRQRLTEAAEQSQRHRSSHEYSLAEYGLSEKIVYEELAEVFKVYGFAK